MAVLERFCAEAATRAQRKIFLLLTEDLSAEQKARLDALLELREGGPYSTFAWLRQPPGAPTARAVLAHIERLRAIRELRISPGTGRRVHRNRLLQIAREAAQTSVYHLREYEADRHYGTLVALMIETAATLTDEILDLNDRLIGSFFTKSKNKYARTFAEQTKRLTRKFGSTPKWAPRWFPHASRGAIPRLRLRKLSHGTLSREVCRRQRGLPGMRTSTRFPLSWNIILNSGGLRRSCSRPLSSGRRRSRVSSLMPLTCCEP